MQPTVLKVKRAGYHVHFLTWPSTCGDTRLRGTFCFHAWTECPVVVDSCLCWWWSPVKKGADVSRPDHRGLDLVTAIASYAC